MMALKKTRQKTCFFMLNILQMLLEEQMAKWIYQSSPTRSKVKRFVNDTEYQTAFICLRTWAMLVLAIHDHEVTSVVL